MKSSGSNWLTTAVVFVVGVLLIVWHSRVDILSWIVISVGIMLIIPSLYSFIMAIGQKGNKDDTKRRTASTSTLWACIGSIALGAWMICDATFFVGLIAYIFGAILVLYGIYHILVVAYWSKPFVLPIYFYIIPVLMIISGIVLLCTNVRTMNEVVVLITGIALVASSINTIMEYMGTHPSKERQGTDV